jgi:hypothetical protein
LCGLKNAEHTQEFPGGSIASPGLPIGISGDLRGVVERYDMAPVLAASDTRILATLAEKTIFVVRSALTLRKVAA